MKIFSRIYVFLSGPQSARREQGFDVCQWLAVVICALTCTGCGDKSHRLETASVTGIVTLDGRASLDFQDPEGQRFRLTEDTPGVIANAWDKSPVPAGHQIHGLGPITISVPDLAPTETEVLHQP